MVHSFRAAALTGYADLARAVGLDPFRMLDAVGIPRGALTDPDMRLPTAAGRDLMENCSRAAEDFGLRLSEMRTPSVMGPVALIAREQPTVRGVVEAVVRYSWLHTEATTVRIEDAADLVIIHVTHQHPNPGPVRQLAELSVAQVVRILRLHLGTGWRPERVSFVHSPPRSAATHHRIFRSDVIFDQDFSGVVCSQADLARPNPGADPAMAREIERYIEGLGGSAQAALQDKVRELVGALLPTGRCTAEFVARQMGVETRTLQRHLASTGTSFLEILQDVRMDHAVRYLEESEKSLAEVTDLLGLSAVSAFSRWHRACFGFSASDRRRPDRTAAPGDRSCSL